MPKLRKVKKDELPTIKLRFVERSPSPLSQRVSLILQQWWWQGGQQGKWRDVPVEKE